MGRVTEVSGAVCGACILSSRMGAGMYTGVVPDVRDITKATE